MEITASVAEEAYKRGDSKKIFLVSKLLTAQFLNCGIVKARDGTILTTEKGQRA